MADRILVKDSPGYHVVITYAGDITKADIYHRPTGLHARGNAKRYREDTYDSRVGANLAYYRALERVATKIVRRVYNAK